MQIPKLQYSNSLWALHATNTVVVAASAQGPSGRVPYCTSQELIRDRIRPGDMLAPSLHGKTSCVQVSHCHLRFPNLKSIRARKQSVGLSF